MATPTYTPLATVTASGSSSSQTVMTSIPQTYTDLILIIQGGANGTGIYFRVGNGSLDTSSNYSYTKMYGYGSGYGSSRASNQTKGEFGGTWSVNDTMILHFQNYSNTTTYKTILGRQSSAADTITASATLWRSTSAIDQIQILTDGANFGSNTTFTLYGIQAIGGDSTPKATGGVVTSDSTYYYHTFLGSNTFTPLQSLTADILVVAGGGGTSWLLSAGGGAGGVSAFASQSLTAQPYTITVGAGGAGLASASIGRGSDGSNSQFGSLTAAVGGGAAGYYTADYANGANGNPGGAGGGGGTQGNHGGGGGSGGSGTSNQGFAGGNGAGGSYIDGGGGGGGGAGAAGSNGTAGGDGGAGGVGATYNTSIGGTAGPYAFIDAMGAATSTGELVSGHYYYAGGGGGGTQRGNGGAGGYGGGGAGSNSSTTPTNGLVNTGGGGGGQRSNNLPAQNGGSGIVIVRYPKA